MCKAKGIDRQLFARLALWVAPSALWFLGWAMPGPSAQAGMERAFSAWICGSVDPDLCGGVEENRQRQENGNPPFSMEPERMGHPAVLDGPLDFIGRGLQGWRMARLGWSGWRIGVVG